MKRGVYHRQLPPSRGEGGGAPYGQGYAKYGANETFDSGPGAMSETRGRVALLLHFHLSAGQCIRGT